LLADVKHLIQQTQYEALIAVNTQLIRLYWEIGQISVARQEREAWGKSQEELPCELLHLLPSPKEISDRLRLLNV
jgi:hypothetical protein